jgi:Uma2 family endonuclease
MTPAEIATALDLELLPGSKDLPCSDDTPVDNEDQNDIPNWLRIVLLRIWANRQDWFFGVDMGIYNREGQRRRSPNLIPDGFLSLGVIRRKGEHGRLSYVLAEENEVIPILALECLSKTYNGEYGSKMQNYAEFGIKYYIVFNPQRRRKHQPLEVYKLEGGQYRLLQGDPVWLPEIELGIGIERGTISNVPMQWLAWYNKAGQPYPLPEKVIENLQQRLTQVQTKLEQTQSNLEQTQSNLEQTQIQLAKEQVARRNLLERLQALGIELEDLDISEL